MPNLRKYHQEDFLWASDYHGVNQHRFALLYESEARGIFELMLMAAHKMKSNYVVLKGRRRLKRAGEGKRSKEHHEKLVGSDFFWSPLKNNVKIMLH